MTREEAIKKLESLKISLPAARDEINGIIKLLDTTWISVKDDLPCNYEELLRNDILTKQVLVVSKDKEDNSIRVCTNYMLKVGIFSQPTNEYRWSGQFYNEVTHWMPLPEPPKE